MTRFVFLSLLLLFFIAPVSAITVSPNAYFGCPIYSTYLHFDSTITLNNIDLRDNWCYFDEYGFQVENANITIIQFFMDDKLIFDTEGTEASTTKIYVADKGKPLRVIGATSWEYDEETKILTINIAHMGIYNIEVHWMPAYLWYVALALCVIVISICGFKFISDEGRRT